MSPIERLEALAARFEKIGKMYSEAVDWADELRAIRAEIEKEREAVRKVAASVDAGNACQFCARLREIVHE